MTSQHSMSKCHGKKIVYTKFNLNCSTPLPDKNCVNVISGGVNCWDDLLKIKQIGGCNKPHSNDSFVNLPKLTRIPSLSEVSVQYSLPLSPVIEMPQLTMVLAVKKPNYVSAKSINLAQNCCIGCTFWHISLSVIVFLIIQSSVIIEIYHSA
jgi:hypothetical protein